MQATDAAHLLKTIFVLALFTAQAGCAQAPLTEVELTQSAYRFRIEACDGSANRRASGVRVTQDLVATAAHSFDQADSFEMFASDGTNQEAQLVYLDPEIDVALLAVNEAEPSEQPLPFGPAPESGPIAIVSYSTSDGPILKDGTLLRRVRATLDGQGKRSALQLEAQIELGDSGGAVTDQDNRLVGMVFASSRQDQNSQQAQGWAVTSEEISLAIEITEAEPYKPQELLCSPIG